MNYSDYWVFGLIGVCVVSLLVCSLVVPSLFVH